MKKIKVLIGLVVIIIVIILLILVFIQNHIETEGNYTGYQLMLTAKYEGHGIGGQNLGSGTKKKIFNISKNDILYEPFSGGLWLLNVDIKEDTNKNEFPSFSQKESEILEIIELEKDTITIKNKDKTYNIYYNQEVEIYSNTHIYDGINYSYVIKITKNNN